MVELLVCARVQAPCNKNDITNNADFTRCSFDEGSEINKLKHSGCNRWSRLVGQTIARRSMGNRQYAIGKGLRFAGGLPVEGFAHCLLPIANYMSYYGNKTLKVIPVK